MSAAPTVGLLLLLLLTQSQKQQNCHPHCYHDDPHCNNDDPQCDNHHLLPLLTQSQKSNTATVANKASITPKESGKALKLKTPKQQQQQTSDAAIEKETKRKPNCALKTFH